jgi:hypothetical protein
LSTGENKLTIKESILENLVNRGMLPQQAEEVFNKIEDAESNKSMLYRWNEDIKEYLPFMSSVILYDIDHIALKWIDENIPDEKHLNMDIEEHYGKKSNYKEYMPDFPNDERTHYQMYEDCSLGTPISPVCETEEELAHWLADNNASTFADMTASYEKWLKMIKVGSSISCFIALSDGKSEIKSGVDLYGEK